MIKSDKINFEPWFHAKCWKLKVWDSVSRFIVCFVFLLKVGHAFHLTLSFVCPCFWVATTTASPSCPLLAFRPTWFLPADFSHQDLILQAHSPHTDLLVDHINSRKTVETEWMNASLYGSMNRVHPGAGVSFLSAVFWTETRLLFTQIMCSHIHTIYTLTWRRQNGGVKVIYFCQEKWKTQQAKNMKPRLVIMLVYTSE